MSITFTSRVPQATKAVAQAKKDTLNAVGIEFSGYAKALTPVEFGRLRSSITWAADGDRRTHRETATPGGEVVQYEATAPKDTVQVGTNVEYAVYVHEDLRAFHQVGEAKFIENAFRRNKQRLENLVRLGLQGKLPRQET